MSSQIVGGGAGSPIFLCPAHGLSAIGIPRTAGKYLRVFNTPKCRASRSPSARTMIGSGLHFFHIGSSSSVGVSFQMHITLARLRSEKQSIVASNSFNFIIGKVALTPNGLITS
jgi:hypothetical protein